MDLHVLLITLQCIVVVSDFKYRQAVLISFLSFFHSLLFVVSLKRTWILFICDEFYLNVVNKYWCDDK